MKKYFLLFLLPLEFYVACLPSNIFEKNISMNRNRWEQNYIPSFTFNITDTVADYLIYFNIRHTDAYPYSNIWLKVKTKMPGTTIFTETNTEIPLAQTDGKWLGRGMNEIWEQQMPMTNNGSHVHFSKPGTYTIALQQIMRMEALPEIMSVGIRLERIPLEK